MGEGTQRDDWQLLPWQLWAHAPQLFGSLVVSMQAIEHTICAPGQALHEPLVQDCPVAHANMDPQPPQFFGSLLVLMPGHPPTAPSFNGCT